jgi:hypothetical protein
VEEVGWWLAGKWLPCYLNPSSIQEGSRRKGDGRSSAGKQANPARGSTEVQVNKSL